MAYTGATFRFRRSSDNVELDFFADSVGNLGTALGGTGTSLSSWLSGASAFVTIWYDQSGGGRHATQTTTTLQPTYSLANENVQFDSSGDFMNVPLTCVGNGDLPYSSVSRHGFIGTNGAVYGFGSGTQGTSVVLRKFTPTSYRVDFHNNFADFNGYANDSVVTVTYTVATKTSRVFCNNVEQTSQTSAGRVGLSGTSYLGNWGSVANSALKGTLHFLFMSNIVLSTSDRRTLEGYGSVMPTLTPSAAPSRLPTVSPTVVPTVIPTQCPTRIPTVVPSRIPTVIPTVTPTVIPTQCPTRIPTVVPTQLPTATPTTGFPTVTPTAIPTQVPTVTPTVAPTRIPTVIPTAIPSIIPTQLPTVIPTQLPTVTPTVTPTQLPTAIPTVFPTAIPTRFPTVIPTVSPTQLPSVIPTFTPTIPPSILPSVLPSQNPTRPVARPTSRPSLNRLTPRPSLALLAPLPQNSTTSRNASAAVEVLSSLTSSQGDVSVITESIRVVGQTIESLFSNSSTAILIPLTDEEKAAGKEVPSINLAAEAAGNSSVYVAVALIDSSLWSTANSSSTTPKVGQLQTGIVALSITGANVSHVDISFPALVGQNETVAAINFTVSCPPKFAIKKAFLCNDTGHVEVVQCNGIEGTLHGQCPLLQATCAALDLTSMTASLQNMCQTIQSNSSNTEPGAVGGGITCRCGLSTDTTTGSSTIAAGVVNSLKDGKIADIKNVAKVQVGSGSGVSNVDSSSITFSKLIYSRFVVCLLGMADKVADDTSLLSSQQQSLLNYIDSLFPAVFVSKSALTGVLHEVYEKHPYINLLFRLHKSRTPIIEVVKIVTLQTFLLFMLALLYDINYPTDDGSCALNMNEKDCLRRKYEFEPTVSYCRWQPLVYGADVEETPGTFTFDDIVSSVGLSECVFVDPSFSFTMLMYVSMMISFGQSLFLEPLEYLLQLLRSPTMTDAVKAQVDGRYSEAKALESRRYVVQSNSIAEYDIDGRLRKPVSRKISTRQESGGKATFTEVGIHHARRVPRRDKRRGHVDESIWVRQPSPYSAVVNEDEAWQNSSAAALMSEELRATASHRLLLHGKKALSRSSPKGFEELEVAIQAQRYALRKARMRTQAAKFDTAWCLDHATGQFSTVHIEAHSQRSSLCLPCRQGVRVDQLVESMRIYEDRRVAANNLHSSQQVTAKDRWKSLRTFVLAHRALSTFKQRKRKRNKKSKASSVPEQVYILNSPRYFFVSHQLAVQFPDLVESRLIRLFRSHLPGQIAVDWHKQLKKWKREQLSRSLRLQSSQMKMGNSPQHLEEGVANDLSEEAIEDEEDEDDHDPEVLQRRKWQNMKGIRYWLYMPKYYFVFLVIQIVINVSLPLQRFIIRVLEPVFFSGLVLCVLLLQSSPIYLGIACVGATIWLAKMLYDRIQTARAARVIRAEVDEEHDDDVGLAGHSGDVAPRALGAAVKESKSKCDNNSEEDRSLKFLFSSSEDSLGTHDSGSSSLYGDLHFASTSDHGLKRTPETSDAEEDFDGSPYSMLDVHHQSRWAQALDMGNRPPDLMDNGGNSDWDEEEDQYEIQIENYFMDQDESRSRMGSWESSALPSVFASLSEEEKDEGKEACALDAIKIANSVVRGDDDDENQAICGTRSRMDSWESSVMPSVFLSASEDESDEDKAPEAPATILKSSDIFKESGDEEHAAGGARGRFDSCEGSAMEDGDAATGASNSNAKSARSTEEPVPAAGREEEGEEKEHFAGLETRSRVDSYESTALPSLFNSISSDEEDEASTVMDDEAVDDISDDDRDDHSVGELRSRVDSYGSSALPSLFGSLSDEEGRGSAIRRNSIEADDRSSKCGSRSRIDSWESFALPSLFNSSSEEGELEDQASSPYHPDNHQFT
eukprot:gene22535-27504_t